MKLIFIKMQVVDTESQLEKKPGYWSYLGYSKRTLDCNLYMALYMALPFMTEVTNTYQSIDLFYKSMDWFLNDRNLRHKS